MEDVNHVIGIVIDRCAKAGIEVSEALVALTARSVRLKIHLYPPRSRALPL